ncbi:Hsp70 family protein [Actinomadura graeca]|uniref:Hsp70 family protein n=1 Tax=Actinomadura graeca TaxID=2750812 RepID=A0ABX8QU47_9ACTN|nr:Hsp70 family protein [Actinomadura graeca]QXJ21489.1 Hsp70 family protein [Actinomadura graeca]
MTGPAAVEGRQAEVAVGIDLGTTYSAVAWVNGDGDPEIIPDVLGDPLTASVVGLGADGRPVVGGDAKQGQADGADEVAHLFKRWMGNPAFRLPLGGREWTPAELSALVLGHLKAQAEDALGRPVTRAVVTVPEYFTHPERAATLEAGRLAGLEVPRLISEPTAAALAYGLRPAPGTRRVLVYDLGGGTFDISLVEIGEEEITVVAAEGDHELGGRDWDDRLAGEVLRGLPREDAAALGAAPGALLVEVERAKQALSARRSAEVRVTARGRTVRAEVTREAFEEATRDLLEQTGQLAAKLLRETGLDWDGIDGVLPVGGSTRMPMVGRWIERTSGRPPMGGIHPDHAVALGAAAQAAILLEEEAAARPRLPGPAGDRAADAPILRLGAPRRISNVVAHSLGMIAESAEGDRYLNSVLLPRNQRIPSVATRPYQFGLKGDGGDEMEVFLTQGETEDVEDCAYLGRYVVTGFPASRGGRRTVVDVSYAYDDNALVGVTARERGTGTDLEVTVHDLPPDVPDRFLEAPPRTASREPMTVYLAFDLSGSMAGHPLSEAQRAARTFVGQLDLTTTAVGLIGFSDRVDVALRATNNGADVSRAVKRLEVGTTGIGNAADPFDTILELLGGTGGRRFSVVLADGVWAYQRQATERARRCHEEGIEIVAVGFGGADHEFLKGIASSTEQALFTRLGELSTVFGTIAREITETGGGR